VGAWALCAAQASGRKETRGQIRNNCEKYLWRTKLSSMSYTNDGNMYNSPRRISTQWNKIEIYRACRPYMK